MGDATDAFAERLVLALKAASIGRARLAADVGVDKSLVSRWLGGSVRPSAHNLERLTRLIAQHLPGFSLLDWDADDAAFADRVGIGAPAPAKAAPDGDVGAWLPMATAQSRAEVVRDGARYPGIYVGIRRRFANDGRDMAEIVPIWREGDVLHTQNNGPFWAHSGRIFILGHQLFVIVEDRLFNEGMGLQILNGVGVGKAMSLDGILATVPQHRGHAPAATIVVMLRIAELRGEGAPDPAWLVRCQDAIHAFVEADRVAEISGAAIMAHIGNNIHQPHADGTTDTVLRAPADRGMTTSTAHPSPVITAAIAR